MGKINEFGMDSYKLHTCVLQKCFSHWQQTTFIIHGCLSHPLFYLLYMKVDIFHYVKKCSQSVHCSLYAELFVNTCSWNASQWFSDSCQCFWSVSRFGHRNHTIPWTTAQPLAVEVITIHNLAQSLCLQQPKDKKTTQQWHHMFVTSSPLTTWFHKIKQHQHHFIVTSWR